jgi:hypothetical protein
MRPMRFPRRFPWLIVFLIAVGPVLFSVPLTIWYSFTMPPLERYYYDAYFSSTALKNSPGATTDVQWIFKTAPGRTEELAGPTDIVSGSSADQKRLAIAMKLSSAARSAGWKSLEQGSKERVNAAELQRYLQASFYDGEGFWQLLLQPALWGVAFMVSRPVQTGRASRTPHERAGAAVRSALESQDKSRWYSTAFAVGQSTA